MSTSPAPVVTVATVASTPAPEPKASGFKSFLSAVGHAFKDVFAWLGSQQGQQTITAVEGTATIIATAINPALGASLTGVETLINAALKQAVQIETVAAAAGAQAGTGAQKAAAVVDAIAPNVGAFLATIGVSQATEAEIQALATTINNGVVAILNAIPAPAAPAA